MWFLNYFNKSKQDKNKVKPKTKAYSAFTSAYGRDVSTIFNEKNYISHQSIEFNPTLYHKNEKIFWGLNHLTNDEIILNEDDITHSLILGATGSGKGVLFGNLISQYIKMNKGIIIIDPKEDSFLPNVIKDTLKNQNRSQDLIITNWPNNFKLKTFDEDNYIETTNKLTVMLDLIEVADEAGASHYRKSERIALTKAIKLFYQSEIKLSVLFENNLLNFINFLEYLVSDIEATTEYNKEINKTKPNFNILNKYSKRYFEPMLLSEHCPFKSKDIPTLESLLFSLSEFKDIKFTEEISLKEALINGKIIYIKADMLSQASLKYLKFILSDILQQSRKYKDNTNCVVIADELSFYATPILSATLATIRGFGVKFFLAMQDLAQLSENLRAPILSNCTTKFLYKTSDVSTLEYISKLAGDELITKISIQGQIKTIKQETQPYMNLTKLRAIPKSKVGLLIFEDNPIVDFVATAPIKTNPFDWSIENNKIAIQRIKTITKSFNIEDTNKSKIQEENNEDLNFDDSKTIKFDI